ncbi:MAG TPA: 4Fe-4S dicluster domain-containing protein [bacterium]|jgi:molybdopterin-containing oxidoreductase family iron-sulfur binding subunit
MIKDEIDLIEEAKQAGNAKKVSRREFLFMPAKPVKNQPPENQSGLEFLKASGKVSGDESCCGGTGESSCGCASHDEEDGLEVDLSVIDSFVYEQMENGGDENYQSPSGEFEHSSTSGINRRDFLKCSAAGAIATAVASMNAQAESLIKEGVQFGMIIDIRRCMGDSACVVACKAENKTPPGVDYNVLWAEEYGEYPDIRRDFIFRPCLHCEIPSCVYPCPTQATFKRDVDGVVVVDYDICIGCRYCIAGCPYGARSFDYGHWYNEPPADWEKQPSPEYGENRVRKGLNSPIGNVRKCSFCLHRVYKGLNPACAESCAPGAIHFGNINDPEATCRLHGENLHELLRTRNHFRLKEELGNKPSVYYLT